MATMEIYNYLSRHTRPCSSNDDDINNDNNRPVVDNLDDEDVIIDEVVKESVNMEVMQTEVQAQQAEKPIATEETTTTRIVIRDLPILEDKDALKTELDLAVSSSRSTVTAAFLSFPHRIFSSPPPTRPDDAQAAELPSPFARKSAADLPYIPRRAFAEERCSPSCEHSAEEESASMLAKLESISPLGQGPLCHEQ
ncbi:hypothetical protein Drorol1_Dr00022280 [Drosera rotundifolia]